MGRTQADPRVRRIAEAVRRVQATEDEATLQQRIGAAFAADPDMPATTAEVRITDRDRPDFMVGRVAVEVKTRGSAAALTRQIARYAEHEGVDSVVLVTTKRRLAAAMPPELNGKRIVAVVVEGGL